MKKMILALAGIAFIASCADAPDGEAATTTDTQNVVASSGTIYNVSNESVVTWYGATPTHGHKGSFNVTEGTLSVEEGEISGGSFVMNVASMKNLDKDTNGGAKLMGHLLSGDFFDAGSFPTAKFEITNVEPTGANAAEEGVSEQLYNISGNLTLKDSTKNVVIPTTVRMEGESLTATSKFTIDRTDWGMQYGNDEGFKG